MYAAEENPKRFNHNVHMLPSRRWCPRPTISTPQNYTYVMCVYDGGAAEQRYQYYSNTESSEVCVCVSVGIGKAFLIFPLYHPPNKKKPPITICVYYASRASEGEDGTPTI